MIVTPTRIPDVLIIEPKVFADRRGTFYESYNQAEFDAAIPGARRFVQHNHSTSHAHVLRGLHYQIGQPQAKLLSVGVGEIFDVAVDLRRSSPTFRQWTGITLTAANRRQLWIPEGFAHGFLVLSPIAEVSYKTTDYYAPREERTILWNDPALGIEWPVSSPVILSDKDAQAGGIDGADLFP